MLEVKGERVVGAFLYSAHFPVPTRPQAEGEAVAFNTLQLQDITDFKTSPEKRPDTGIIRGPGSK